MKRQKKVGFYTKTRDPLNTFSSFWDAPVSQIKTGRNKDVIITAERPMLMQEETDDAREKHSGGAIGIDQTTKTKKPTKGNYPPKKLKTQEERDEWRRIRNEKAAKKAEKEAKGFNESYKSRLNFDYTKKRHFGRFTRNPSAKRSIVPVEPKPENPISNVRYKGDLVSHVRQLLLGKDK
jgi:hypothetical protein